MSPEEPTRRTETIVLIRETDRVKVMKRGNVQRLLKWKSVIGGELEGSPILEMG